MNKNKVRIFAVGATLATSIFAQNQRQASMVGGGGPDRGKCTIEVVVDGVAQVEIHGTTANLRTMSGQPAQWRRFVCSGALPPNPGSFRFAGVDGRGRQELVREPRNGGAAVIQIEDRDGGSEGYTFDIFWDARGGFEGPRGGPPPPPRAYDRPGPGDRRSGAFGTEEAIRVCQDEVRIQASRRFRTDNIRFRRTTIDDNPGRNDWVLGSLDVRFRGREERFGFSCSVNFQSGRVRSAQLDDRPMPYNPR